MGVCMRKEARIAGIAPVAVTARIAANDRFEGESPPERVGRGGLEDGRGIARAGGVGMLDKVVSII
jgi:hypothetical protein